VNVKAVFSPIGYVEGNIRIKAQRSAGNGDEQNSSTSSGCQVSSFVFTSLLTRMSIFGFAYRILGKSSFRKWLWIHSVSHPHHTEERILKDLPRAKVVIPLCKSEGNGPNSDQGGPWCLVQILQDLREA
jgi:hypothetical protein